MRHFSGSKPGFCFFCCLPDSIRVERPKWLPGWPLKGKKSSSQRLPAAWPYYARLPSPKSAVFTWKSPDFSCLLPACLTFAAATCTSLACLPDLVLGYCQAGRKKNERRFLATNRPELLKTRNQLHTTRDRVETYRMKLEDSLLECPASLSQLSVSAAS